MEDLQEAYLAIYEESLADRTRGSIQNDRLEDEQSRTQASIDRMKRQPKVTRGSAALAAKRVESDVKRASSYGPQHPKPGQTGAYRIGEDVDLYDLVLDYLLDEGYADSEDNAITIMANMSEEWIDTILDEAQIMSVSGKGGLKYMINPKILRAQNAAAKEAQGRKAREKAAKEEKNAARALAARQTSIATLNANPGANRQDYENTDFDTADTRGYHYDQKHSSRSARTRRARG